MKRFRASKYFSAQHTFAFVLVLAGTMVMTAERKTRFLFLIPCALALQEFLSLTRLTEKSGAKNDSQGFIRELLADHESIIIFLRENINPFAADFKDAGTSDYITGLMEDHEKLAWMLRAHLP